LRPIEKSGWAMEKIKRRVKRAAKIRSERGVVEKIARKVEIKIERYEDPSLFLFLEHVS
jgi:hypothetical protein